jgi:hypothetical protein
LSLNRKYLIYGICLLILFMVGFIFPHYLHRPRIKLGEHEIFCNPKTKINCKKKYNLSLWDYDWPLASDKHGYQKYLHSLIRDFQTIYPDIQVKLTLLDLLSGPDQLAQALKTNQAPDVYCSAYAIPPFDFQHQIPVGPFLNPREKGLDLPDFNKLVEVEGVQCDFPRWSALGIWIGNRDLLEKAGLSVSKIQKGGWTWEELISGLEKCPVGKRYLVGNPGYNGFFTQLMANNGTGDDRSKNPWDGPTLRTTLDLLDRLIAKRVIRPGFDNDMLGRFLNGGAPVLAGVRPILYRFLKEKLAGMKAGWEPVLLPAPHRLPAKEVLLTENGVICVYRNRKTAGDDHLAAAVKLGQFISNYPKNEPWQEMMLIPLQPNPAFRGRNTFLTEDDRIMFERLLSGATVRNVEKTAEFEEKVTPVLRDFCNGKISKEEALNRLQELKQKI